MKILSDDGGRGRGQSAKPKHVRAFASQAGPHQVRQLFMPSFSRIIAEPGIYALIDGSAGCEDQATHAQAYECQTRYGNPVQLSCDYFHPASLLKNIMT